MDEHFRSATMAQPLALAIVDRAFPSHPFFPQLKAASEPGLMLQFFQEHLRPVSTPGPLIRQCVPVRFRWRSDGSRCVLQYALGLGTDDNERLSNLWVTVVVYAHARQAESAWSKQTSASEWRLIPRTLFAFEPLTLVPDLGMLVYLFPYDRLLPNLVDIITGPWTELQQRLIGCSGPGPWQTRQQFPQPIRYRAEGSAVFRFVLHGRNMANRGTETKRFYAKAYRTTYGEQIAHIYRQLYQKTSGADEGFAVAEPLFYCPQRLCLFLDEARGHSLHDQLASGSRANSLTGVRRVAGALAAFNKSKIMASVHHSAEQQVDFLERAAVLLRWACPSSRTLIDYIVNTVKDGLRDVEPVPILWDLKSDHVFLDDDRVTFIDLDTVSLGDPARDPAHLAAHLACRIDVPGMDAPAARAVAEAFVEEYFSHVPGGWQKQFELQFLIAVIEAACGLFKRQELGWAERVVAAFQEADPFLRAIGRSSCARPSSHSNLSASMGSSSEAFRAG